MPLVSLCFLLGAYALECLPHLPGPVVFGVLLLLAVASMASRFTRAPGFILLGFSAMGVAATVQLDDRLDPAMQATTVDTVVAIREFPTSRNGLTTMVVAPQGRDDLPSRMRLSWLEPAVPPQLGESWRLQVRLRRPSGYANPGGFDHEGLLFRRKIGATGYVLQDGHNYRIHGERAGTVERFRSRVVRRISALFPSGEASAVLMAIVVGARHEITREHWDAYADTGTSHLMAISGLHIGIAAGAVYLLVLGTSTLVPGRRNYRNYRERALIAALLAGCSYAAMSGFAVPARRACLMLLIAGVLLLRRREILPSALIATTAVLVFVSDPMTILTPGFKMSFAAVAVLFVAARQHIVLHAPQAIEYPLGQLLRLGHIQIALLAGLMPLTVALFDRFTVIAPLVNMAVLPVFNFVTVPVSIAGALLDGPLSPVGDYLLDAAHKSVELVLAIVALAKDLEWLNFRMSVPVSVMVLTLPLLQILLPTGWPGRRLVLLAALTVATTRPDPLPAACFSYHVLDVGQGLAVVIRTRDHALLFDTGPAFQSGNSTAEMVVQPFLRYRNIDRLDAVVISHGDLDHAGGIHSIMRSTRVGRILGGEHMPSMGNALVPCRAGQRWQWDDVEFRVVHPRNRTAWDGNDLSCVLEVAAGSSRLLLTGDIESPAEILLQYRQMFRRSHVVVVPHHGSRTSSSPALVDETAPEIAIVSAGRMNRWGFPKDDVVSRWHAAGAQVVNTARAGAVSQLLCRDRAPGLLETARSAFRKYWHEEQL